MADDLGYHDLGCYGQQEIQTPRLDRLAASGIRFTDVYAGSSVCAPSRSSLMTGQHAGTTTIRGNFPAEGGRPDMYGTRRLPLPDGDVTVAEVLKQAGYVTGMAGKWGLGEPGTTGEPHRQGFDDFYGFLNQQHAHSYYPQFQWRNGERVDIPENRNGARGRYSHDLHTEFAFEFIRARAEETQPFFLYLPYQIPHSRYEIPSVEPYADRDWSDEAKVHAAMITLLDRDVGRLMDLLEELGLAERTLVFFTSDNGAAQRWEGVFDSSHPLRGRKRDLYEGGIRVPMLVTGPGVPAGVVSSAPWYHPDVLPTLAELAGIPAAVPAAVDGLSVAPALRGEIQPELGERPMYWEFHERGFDQAIRQGRWKAVRLNAGPIELYNLENDLAEAHDLAAEHPEKVAELQQRMSEMRTPSRSWPTPED
jgi:arylsulfatase A-like enzyme